MNEHDLAAEIIDIFECFLNERGIALKNGEKTEAINDGEAPANIYGTDYFDLESEIELIIEREQKKERKVELAEGGCFVIGHGRDDVAEQVYIDYEDMNGYRSGIVLAEVKSPEYAQKAHNRDVDIYVYGDELSEDWTNKFKISPEAYEANE